MHVALAGNSPSTVTAGIMLLTRARQLGFTLQVDVVGDPTDVRAVRGAAVAYAPVLASCGVGRELGSGATVVIPGPPGTPVMATVTPHGIGGWFPVDRSGTGAHAATQAFMRLSSDERVPARHAARQLRHAMRALGMAPEPAVLDVLFGAPAPPLLRLALALRAGRAMSGGRGDSVTRYLAGSVEAARDPIDPQASPAAIAAAFDAQSLQWLFDRVSPAIRDAVEAFVHALLELSRDDDGRDLALLHGLTDVGSHLAQLPVHAFLPPLGAAEDSVAVALGAALTAEGDGDVNVQMCQVFRFLGGRFVDQADHALTVSEAPPPADPHDQVAQWQWFCGEVRKGRKRADALWEDVFHPQQ